MLASENQINRISTTKKIYASFFRNMKSWVRCKDSYAAAFFDEALLFDLIEQEHSNSQHHSLSANQYSEENLWF